MLRLPAPICSHTFLSSPRPLPMDHQSVLKAGDFRGMLLVCSCKWQRREKLGVQAKPNEDSNRSILPPFSVVLYSYLWSVIVPLESHYKWPRDGNVGSLILQITELMSRNSFSETLQFMSGTPEEARCFHQLPLQTLSKRRSTPNMLHNGSII